MLTRILKISLKLVLLLLAIIAVSITILLNTGIHLSEKTEKIIQQASREPLPELISGETGFAQNGDVSIWYEAIKPAGQQKGTIVLMMGAAGNAIFWPDYFINALLDNGYQVIRYDYRSIGMSDWIEDWSENNAYRLSDMTADVASIMDKLGVEQAHILGLSMGGLVARQFVLDYPERSISLTSLSSMGLVGQLDDEMKFDLPILDLIRLGLRYGIFPSEDDQVRLIVGVLLLMNGESVEPLNIKLFAQQAYYELRKRRGFNPAALRQHFYAIGSSIEKLDAIVDAKIPVLVIHGTLDPVASFDQAQFFSQQLAMGTFLPLDGVGHVFPESRASETLKSIVIHMQQAVNVVPKNTQRL